MDIERLARPSLKELIPYMPGKPVEVVQRERNTATAFTKLASNENPYTPHAKICDAVMKELAGQGNRYPESGCYYLVNALSRHLSVPFEEIFVGNGSNEILDLLVRAFVNDDENCIIPRPSFVIYGMVCQLAGARAIVIPNREEFHLDLAGMRAAVNAKTKMVFLCNPNNPTATYFSSAQFEAFLDGLPEDILVVIDEAYFEYVNAHDYPDCLSLRKQRNTIIVLRTFSKMYSLAGVRIGYAIADEAVVRCLHKVRQPFNVSRIAQAAALAALEYKDDIFAVVREIIAARDAIREELLGLGCSVPPSQTNFLYVVPPPDDADVCERLLDRGVIVRSMQPWGGTGNTFRVTVGTPDENRQFIEALKDVLRA
jgi:histidinol-phosphate aminotransferase